jgi:beta-galactosidase
MQNIYINGKLIAKDVSQKQERHSFDLGLELVKPGENEIMIAATPYHVRNSWESPNTDPGVVQVVLPAAQYSRSLFSGYAQVLVQSTKEKGVIKLTARSEGMAPAVLMLEALDGAPRPSLVSQ